MPATPATRPGATVPHLAYIDALRALAFLGVLLVHTAQLPGFHGYAFAQAGQYGVQLFFLLSAVTLFRSLSVRGRAERHPIRNYFLRRFFRIAPLFWFGIVLYTFLFGTGPSARAPAGLGPWQFFTTATFTHGWMPSTINAVVPGGWSIAVEMTFYLCLPFLFRHVPTLWSALVSAFAALVLGGVVARLTGAWLYPHLPASEGTTVWLFLNYWFPAQLPVFLLGAALYYALHTPAVAAFLMGNRSRPLILLTMSAFGWYALRGADGGFWLPRHVLYAVAFVPLILGLSARPFAPLVNRATCTLGTISYSAYLTHFAALEVVGRLLPQGPFTRLPHGGPILLFAAAYVSALLLTVLFSTATYWWIEQPGIAIGKKIIRRGERPTAPIPLPQAPSS